MKGNCDMPFPFTQYPDSLAELIQPLRAPGALLPVEINGFISRPLTKSGITHAM